MIFLKRKRLILWLVRAYLKKWGKVIVTSVLIGIIFFALIYFNRSLIASSASIANTQTIGIAGDFPEYDFPNNLPPEISEKTSRGLTKVLPNGEIAPDIASKWEVKDDGKTYVFYLNDDLTFSDGSKLTSQSINFNFADVVVERPADSVIIFKLKNKYSPFLVTVAQNKVFNKDLVGVSSFDIKDIKSQDGFIRSIELFSKIENKKIRYQFYPSQVALKDAYVLGDVSKIIDLGDLSYKDNINFDSFKNTTVGKEINKDKITTVFINNSDTTLSDKKIRKALAYSVPEAFLEGERVYTPYRKDSWYYNTDQEYKKDLRHAKEQLEDSSATQSGSLKLNLKTLRQYKSVAEKLSKSWQELGINTQIEVVDEIPRDYQMFLGDFPVLNDPDQYTLWHSRQPTNITRYKNLRIDKLLEDGRQTTNQNDRKVIYNDFQKYLIDDMPAIFLYFPYTYTLSRN